MELIIYIPNKDIPKHQEVIDIRLHFIDGHIVDADGYGFVELPKGHGRLIDDIKLKAKMFGLPKNSNRAYWDGVDVVGDLIDKAPTIIEADKGESEVSE